LLQAIRDYSLILVLVTDRNGANPRPIVRLNSVNERTRGATLHGSAGNDNNLP
jgi:hypothetical protein